MCGPGCTGTSSSPRCKGTSSGSGCTGTSSSPRCTGTSCGTKGKGTSRSWVLQYIRSCWITLAVFAFGATIRGEWLLIGIHVLRQFGMLDTEGGPSSPEPAWSGASLGPIRLQNLPTFWLIANGVGFAIYFLVGGFLHWHFYVKQRDKPEDWKCQATKWLSADLERAEIVFGSFSLMVVNTFTSILACHIANGGYSTVYYKYDQFSWSWYFAQWPVIFCYQDYTTYWLHRWYHTPWLYKKFHKAHHRYVQPTAFSVTAIHPVEIVHIQLTLCLPMFTIPTHWTSFTAIALYTYYNGIIDHSGVDFKAPRWQPWRPDTIFHDNHHQYFHVNFGFNCYFWDIIHGTYRKADRIYKEDIFYGKGKPFCEASIEELKDEISQRRIENPRAHRTFNPLLNQEEVLQDLKHLNQGLCR